jgi:hypothetical protein
MNCIFCHKTSNSSKSVEHIVPESLGNKHTVLWKGAVCDNCNNYFATKIEKELLNQSYFISLRHRNIIKTKKNRTVPQKVLLPIKGKMTNAWFEYDGMRGNIYLNSKEGIESILMEGRIIEPIIIEPESNNYILSRFLAKCAYEYLVFRVGEKNFIAFSEYIKEDEQFAILRQYARYGEGCKFWPYYQRRIYGEGDMFCGLEENKIYETLNEMDFLSIELERKLVNGVEAVVLELYYVLVIMGIEYVVHLAAPEIDGYELWLKKNNNISPIEKYGEKRIPNIRSNTPQITEELIKRMRHTK